MSLFSKIRSGRPSLTDPDPETRLKALAAIDTPTDAQARQLEELARRDPDARVRRRAIGRISNSGLLTSLLDDETLGDDAAARLVALDAGQCPDHPRVLRAQLAAGRTPAPGNLAVTDAEGLVELTLASRGQALDELLGHDEYLRADALALLERRSRGRNKHVNRFARERLDGIKTWREACAAHRGRLEELLVALEKHAAGSPDAAGHRDKRIKLEAAARAELERLSGALDALARHGEAPVAVEALARRLDGLPPLPEQPAEAPGAEDPTDPFARLTAEFTALGDALTTEADFATLAARRQALTDSWLETANHAPPAENQHRVFEQVSHRFRELKDAVERLSAAGVATAPPLESDEIPADAAAATELWRQVAAARRWLRRTERALARVDWPAWAPPAATLAGLLDARRTFEDRLERLDEAGVRMAATLNDRLADLTGHIDAGASATAQHLLAEIRHDLKRLPRDAAGTLERDLNHQAARLGELKDWQAFATSPKREGLCDDMAALAEAPLDPPTQAERIKALRKQWSGLGPPSSAADRALADRFNAEAEKAFEPCRQHFAAQAEARATNLEARRQIVSQLETYLENTDWDSADIKAAEQIMRTARSEWQRFHPVDRRAGKSLQGRFERLQSTLHDHIKTVWDRNLEAKRDIVAAAEALAAGDAPLGEQISGAKALQSRWRAVGPTPRRPDQQLWQQFRAACDNIFESRDAANRAADDAIAGTQQEAEKLLEEFAERLESEGPANGMLREYHERFQALPRLPERLLRPLERRLAELERELRAQLKARAALERAREIDALLSAGNSPPGTAAVPEVVAEPTLHRLVLEAELAAELESPPADRELRMALQVELMNTGRSREALDADALDLARRWQALGPKPAGTDGLRERFARALKTLNDS